MLGRGRDLGYPTPPRTDPAERNYHTGLLAQDRTFNTGLQWRMLGGTGLGGPHNRFHAIRVPVVDDRCRKINHYAPYLGERIIVWALPRDTRARMRGRPGWGGSLTPVSAP